MSQTGTVAADRAKRTATPLVDIARTEGGVVLNAEMPGLRREDIAIELTGDELTVRGVRRETGAPEGYTSLYSERCPYEYSRSFVLGDEVAREGITAKYENGLLTVAIPLAAEKRPKRIEIQE